MNAIFPASYSTLDEYALALMITEKYGLENVQCKMLVRGVGDTYLIESMVNRFILRIYRSTHRSLSQINAETELLTALKQAGMPVSYPIADLYANFIQTLTAIEGNRYAVLFSYANGQSLTLLNENQLKDLGKQMARFHNISSAITLSNKRWEFNLETTLYNPLETVKYAFADNTDDYEWFVQAAAHVQKKLAELNTANFSIGYCHFDFLPKNFHFDGDEVIFFDFDFFGYGWLVNDIMTFWQHLSLDVFAGRMTEQVAGDSYTTFINSYRQYRDLSEDELKAVPYLSLGFWVFYMGFHATHDQFYPLIQPASLKLRTGLIRKLMEKQWGIWQ